MSRSSNAMRQRRTATKHRVRLKGMRGMLRTYQTVAIALGLGLAAIGCKDDAKPVPTAPVDTTAINAEEADLMSRRDALLKSRQGIRDEQQKLDEERRARRAAGEDTSELDRKADELRVKETDLGREEDDLNAKFDAVLDQRRE